LCLAVEKERVCRLNVSFIVDPIDGEKFLVLGEERLDKGSGVWAASEH
jgi:hypothetical protein